MRGKLPPTTFFIEALAYGAIVGASALVVSFLSLIGLMSLVPSSYMLVAWVVEAGLMTFFLILIDGIFMRGLTVKTALRASAWGFGAVVLHLVIGLGLLRMNPLFLDNRGRILLFSPIILPLFLAGYARTIGRPFAEANYL